MLVTDFDYFLPQEKIAQIPIEPRDHSKLLVLDKNTGAMEHQVFYNLENYLTKNDLLVFNDTKVMPARLIGYKTTGAKIEVFLLHQINSTDWEVLVKPGKKALPGTKVKFPNNVSCDILEKTAFGGRIARFEFEGDFNEKIDSFGEVPLPPYIHEKLQNKDRYQTVYAEKLGSAAAPTAGLHFTKDFIEKIKQKGVQTTFVTLNVGLGTFRPVSEENIEDHKMHVEYFNVCAETSEKINRAKQNGGRIISVGTTPLRVMESIGKDGVMEAGKGKTDIFIYPGFKFQIVDALITNFHLPQSTLLMLVSAFSNREIILNAYKTAIENDYRFFSFGDAMFIK